jgi:DNA polymerase (family 10)
MTNKDIADLLTRIADLLQIKGEVIYKILAYRKAAESILGLGRDIKDIHREGQLEAIPGVGKAIAEKLSELLDSGKLGFYDKLIAEVPESLAELLAVPDLGPKKIKLFWQEAGVTSLAELRAAVESGKLRDLPGMGAKSEAKLLDGLASLARRGDRMLLGRALPASRSLLEAIAEAPGVEAIEVAGSLRRRKETVGDLDILVASRDADAVMAHFVSLPAVGRVLGRGAVKCSVEFVDGTRAQLWVHPPERFGTALQYATGSKDHNVRLRELALGQGLSLSEHALTPVDGGEELRCATEEGVYAALGLPWIPPELREDRGEIQAAQDGALPLRLEASQILSSLHNHSTWSDGRASIREMADAAIQRGLKVLAITDHSSGLGVTQGVDAEGLARQREEIDRLQAELGGRIRLLQGIEVEIKADGGLDLDDATLAGLDIVIASMHVGLRQNRQQVTARMLSAIRNPHVDIIGHPTGRLIQKREPADLDMDAVLDAALATGVALEINANPARLDLNEAYARRASQMGIPISLNTDAHRTEHFDLLEYGVAIARRAWLEPEGIINAWEPDRLLSWLARRGAADAGDAAQ